MNVNQLVPLLHIIHVPLTCLVSDSEVRLIIRINTMFMLISAKESTLCLDLFFDVSGLSTYWQCGFHVIMIRMDVRHLSSKSIAN